MEAGFPVRAYRHAARRQRCQGRCQPPMLTHDPAPARGLVTACPRLSPLVTARHGSSRGIGTRAIASAVPAWVWRLELRSVGYACGVAARPSVCRLMHRPAGQCELRHQSERCLHRRELGGGATHLGGLSPGQAPGGSGGTPGDSSLAHTQFPETPHRLYSCRRLHDRRAARRDGSHKRQVQEVLRRVLA